MCEFPAFWPPQFCLDPQMHSTSYSVDFAAPVCAFPSLARRLYCSLPFFSACGLAVNTPPHILFDEDLLDLSQFITSAVLVPPNSIVGNEKSFQSCVT